MVAVLHLVEIRKPGLKFRANSITDLKKPTSFKSYTDKVSVLYYILFLICIDIKNLKFVELHLIPNQQLKFMFSGYLDST